MLHGSRKSGIKEEGGNTVQRFVHYPPPISHSARLRGLDTQELRRHETITRSLSIADSTIEERQFWLVLDKIGTTPDILCCQGVEMEAGVVQVKVNRERWSERGDREIEIEMERDRVYA